MPSSMPSVSVDLRSVVLSIDLGVNKVIFQREAGSLQESNDVFLMFTDNHQIYQ
ncbi:hypothetical protein D3C71_2208970 [compost metagenome]